MDEEGWAPQAAKRQPLLASALHGACLGRALAAPTPHLLRNPLVSTQSPPLLFSAPPLPLGEWGVNRCILGVCALLGERERAPRRVGGEGGGGEGAASSEGASGWAWGRVRLRRRGSGVGQEAPEKE